MKEPDTTKEKADKKTEEERSLLKHVTGSIKLGKVETILPMDIDLYREKDAILHL